MVPNKIYKITWIVLKNKILTRANLMFFSKRAENIPDVANGVTHKLAKYQFQILCIPIYTKMAKVWI